MSTLKKIRGRYLMTLLAMCGLAASSLGILTNVAGIFFAPIAAEFGKETAAVNMTLTISNLCFAVAGMLSVRFIRPKNFCVSVIVYTLLFAGSTALLALCRDLSSLYALNAVRGFAAGMVGSVLATTIIGRWFLTDTGFISSLALGCSGLIGALFNPLLEAVIQAAGWRAAYLAAAAAVLLLNLPAMLLPIGFRPEDVKLEPLRTEGTGGAAARSRPMPMPASAAPKAILPLALIAISLGSVVCAAPQLFKPIAASYGLAGTGIVMMSVVLAANTGGKFLFGLMTDRLGVRLSVLIYGLVIAAGILLLLLVRVPAAMLGSAAMMGMCYSIPTVGAVMICRELFAPEQYTRVFPMINLGGSIANALGYPLLGVIYDKTGSYDAALLLLFLVMLSTVAGVLLVYRLNIAAGKAER